MADRAVTYRLQANITQFRTQMAAAGASTKGLSNDLTGTTATAGKTSKGLDALGLSAGTVAAVGIAAIVTKSADFEKAMSGVQAATHETTANMESLKQAALEAGAQTSFSATEAAAGIENLAKAGISTADILDGGLSGALSLAAAGELGVADASEIAATALTQFNLAGSDVGHVADLLAAGAGKAQGSVNDLGMALNQSGLVASQMGLSIEETTGTLAAFAAAGLVGSDSGTSLKTMLLRLANPSKEAAKAMEQFGISAYDAQGNMLPMADIAGQLQTAFQGQKQATRDAALATIFGSDAIRGANVLYTQGAEGIGEWTAKVDDAGFAAETASIRLDNLRGDLEYLMGSLETGLIGAGEGSQSSLRGTTQAATELLDVLNEINSKSAVTEGTSSLSMGGITPDILELGLSNLGKTRNAIFGVDEATKDAAGSTEEKADADRAAAASSDRLAGAVQASAEELKAQADALEDARDAARDAAGGFVNLGDSLNDAEKSLGQWIKQMADQADALRNFRLNAEEAADKGLRKGLIAALQDAGPEGALRMKQLANATKAEIDKANKAWSDGQREVGKYVNAVTGASNMPDIEVGVITRSKTALAKLYELQAFKIGDKTIRIHTQRVGGGDLDYISGGGSFATGGHTGPGGKYEPAGIVHRGEYVFDAKATKGNEAYLASLHSQLRGYAGGGMVGASVPAGVPMIDDALIGRLASAMLQARPMYGPVSVNGDPTVYKRQMQADARASQLGGRPV